MFGNGCVFQTVEGWDRGTGQSMERVPFAVAFRLVVLRFIWFSQIALKHWF